MTRCLLSSIQGILPHRLGSPDQDIDTEGTSLEHDKRIDLEAFYKPFRCETEIRDRGNGRGGGDNVVRTRAAKAREQLARTRLTQHGARLVDVDRPEPHGGRFDEFDEDAAQADDHQIAEGGVVANADDELDPVAQHWLQDDVARLAMRREFSHPGYEFGIGVSHRIGRSKAKVNQFVLGLVRQMCGAALQYDRVSERTRSLY